MLGSDVQETCRIANTPMYEEQAIAHIKWYRIISNELEISLPPLCDDIVTSVV